MTLPAPVWQTPSANALVPIHLFLQASCLQNIRPSKMGCNRNSDIQLLTEKTTQFLSAMQEET